MRNIDCSTRVVTWSTSAVATAGLTAGAVAAETRDVVGRRELATAAAGELDVGVELVEVAIYSRTGNVEKRERTKAPDVQYTAKKISHYRTVVRSHCSRTTVLLATLLLRRSNAVLR